LTAAAAKRHPNGRLASLTRSNEVVVTDVFKSFGILNGSECKLPEDLLLTVRERCNELAAVFDAEIR